MFSFYPSRMDEFFKISHVGSKKSTRGYESMPVVDIDKTVAKFVEDFPDTKKYIINTKAAKKFHDEYVIDDKEIDVREIVSLPFDSVAIYFYDEKSSSPYTVMMKEGDEDIECIIANKLATVDIKIPIKMKENNNEIKVMMPSCFQTIGSIMVRRCHVKEFSKHHFGYIDDEIISKLDKAFERELKYSLENIFLFLNLLTNKETIVGSNNFKLRTKLDKKTVKIRDFTSISLKRYESSSNNFYNTQWSHGFWVSGHWRKNNDKLGKDRKGNYVVFGRTWIKEHTRKDELGVIEKTRLLK